MVKFLNYNFKNVDVESVMGNINNYLLFGDKGDFSENLDIYDIETALNELQNNLIRSNMTYNVSLDVNITACKKFKRLKILIKKIIKKICHWYIFEIQQQQNEYNVCIVRTLNIESELVKYLIAENKKLKKNNIEMISNLKEIYDKDVAELRKENEYKLQEICNMLKIELKKIGEKQENDSDLESIVDRLNY